MDTETLLKWKTIKPICGYIFINVLMALIWGLASLALSDHDFWYFALIGFCIMPATFVIGLTVAAIVVTLQYFFDGEK